MGVPGRVSCSSLAMSVRSDRLLENRLLRSPSESSFLRKQHFCARLSPCSAPYFVVCWNAPFVLFCCVLCPAWDSLSFHSTVLASVGSVASWWWFSRGRRLRHTGGCVRERLQAALSVCLVSLRLWKKPLLLLVVKQIKPHLFEKMGKTSYKAANNKIYSPRTWTSVLIDWLIRYAVRWLLLMAWIREKPLFMSGLKGASFCNGISFLCTW